MNGRDTVTQPASNWPQIMMQQAVTGKAEMAMSYGSTDIRLEVRGEEVLEAIVAKSSLVLRKIGGGRAGEVAAGRFLDNDDVTPQSIIATSAERTLEAARGRRVLAIQDTTEVNFSGRAAKRTGLGPAGDGVSPGLFCHPLVLVDIVHEAVLGLAAAKIWTRPQAPAGNRKTSRRRRLPTRAACSSSRPLGWSPPSASCSWSMPATAVQGPPPM